MTSKHVELAFEKAHELVHQVWGQLPAELMSHTLLESVFNALVVCDDDAKLTDQKLKEAA